MKLEIVVLSMWIHFTHSLGPFSLFSIIRFPNAQCHTSTGRIGICYTPHECEKFGGAATGQCAEGYGTCCLMEASCGGEAKTNLTYFVSPRYPLATTDSALCDFKVNKTKGICQLRLDMEQFEIEGAVNGDCDMDLFMVMGLAMNVKVPKLCGKNTEQHVYVDVEHANGPLTLRILIGDSRWGRRWSIRVTSIECTSQYKPPQPCHQYHTAPTGTIQSFGYDEFESTGFHSYTNNMDYTICFQRHPNMCHMHFETVHNDSFRVIQCPEPKTHIETDVDYEATTWPATSANDTLDFNDTLNEIWTSESRSDRLCAGCEGDFMSIFGLDRICGNFFSTNKAASFHDVIKGTVLVS